ncbi:MAG: UvrD-helicase domain-containing protein [Verrucomicrobia bacterium]|nr:UvrD-helicase domain-containing protein [Verrucomicrobiota bacterium]
MPAELHLLNSPLSPGLTVIEASAGTGKTYSISHLVPRLLLEGTLPDLSKLLLVTFTKDAARELSDRVRKVLTQLAAPPSPVEATSAPDRAALRRLLDPAQNPAAPAARLRLDHSLLDLDLLAVSTIHAFCQRTLQQEGALCGLPVLPEVITDDAEHLEPLVRAQWITTLAADPTLAALATAQDWSLSDTLRFLNTRRRCLDPRFDPPVESYPALLARLPGLIQNLADPARWSAAQTLLASVPKWKKDGPTDADAARALLAPLATAASSTTAFWRALAAAATLPDQVNKTSKAGKTAQAALAENSWFANAAELHQLTPRLLWAWQHHLANECLPRLAAVLERHRLITQDGLIGALYHALHRPGAEGTAQSDRLATRLAERYHVALIDESQDTDPRQFAIFKRIFIDASPRRHLLLVGDPKQAIYSFRGADLATYLAARATAAEDARFTLSRTFRAPAPLVSALNSLFARDHAFLNPGMAFTPAVSGLTYDRQLVISGQPASRLETWIVPAADAASYGAKNRRVRALSTRIASTITDLLAHGRLHTTALDTGTLILDEAVTPRDCAVLVSTNAQAEAMAEALQARGVPAVVNSGADVFDSDEARDLHILLRAILDPRRTARLRRALATRLLGLDATRLAALDTAPNPPAPAAATRWLEQFAHWQNTWQKRGLSALFSELETPFTDLNPLGVTHRLALVPLTGERRATNYRQLTDLLLEAARETAPRPDELVRWLGQQCARAEARAQTEAHQLQLSSDRPAVHIVTMHKAKGLEYPLVFCPYLADCLWKSADLEKVSAPPATDADSEPQDTLLNLALLDDTAKTARELQLASTQLEERLRLAYVALTRAQVRVWTCSYGPPARGQSGPRISALDWLLRPAAELADHPAYSDAWETLANTDRPTRHETALRELGAEPHGTAPALITFRAPPEPTDTRYAPATTSSTAPAPEPDPCSRRRAARRDVESISEANDQGILGEYFAGSEPLKGSDISPRCDPLDCMVPAKLTAAPRPEVPKGWRVTSFSTLTREKHAHGSPPLAPPVPAAVSSTPGPDAPLFLAAPAGAAVGTALHDWIETWDFSPPDSSALSVHLASSRLPEPTDGRPGWHPTLFELFTRLRAIRLPGCDDAPLHTLCPEPHGSEWHFHLPLDGSLTVGALARCFAEHAPPEHRAYAPQLSALSEEKFQGLLQGFIDRLARHGDAWGVIDWKTNRLGPALSDYDEPALLRCAMDSHYLLQTHLYLVALRRYLRALGLTDAPLAGAWLVFLRAIAPESPRGVLHINPPAALLDALDTLFARPAAPYALDRA